jgi:hypothetical protein
MNQVGSPLGHCGLEDWSVKSLRGGWSLTVLRGRCGGSALYGGSPRDTNVETHHMSRRRASQRRYRRGDMPRQGWGNLRGHVSGLDCDCDCDSDCDCDCHSRLRLRLPLPIPLTEHRPGEIRLGRGLTPEHLARAEHGGSSGRTESCTDHVGVCWFVCWWGEWAGVVGWWMVLYVVVLCSAWYVVGLCDGETSIVDGTRPYLYL